MKMRQWMALALAGCVTASVTACGGSGNTTTTTAASAEETTVAATTEGADTRKAEDASSKGLTPEESKRVYYRRHRSDIRYLFSDWRSFCHCS